MFYIFFIKNILRVKKGKIPAVVTGLSPRAQPSVPSLLRPHQHQRQQAQPPAEPQKEV